MSSVDWSQVRWYRPSDFRYPDKLDPLVIYKLDRMSSILGEKATILDDFRYQSTNPNSQHLLGRAIDFTYIEQPVENVLDSMRAAEFTGIGLYVNAAGVVSYHGDTRTDRSPENPATWGGQKFTDDQAVWSYTGLQSILDEIKAGALPLIWSLILLLGAWWLARHSRD